MTVEIALAAVSLALFLTALALFGVAVVRARRKVDEPVLVFTDWDADEDLVGTFLPTPQRNGSWHR